MVLRVSSFLLITAMVICSCTSNETDGKIGYVDNLELFDGFTMTERFQLEIDSIRGKANQELEGLAKQVEIRAKSIKVLGQVSESETKEFMEMREHYLFRKQELENMISTHVDSLRAITWDSLNTYISEYGKQEGLAAILGANGTGTLMYADSSMNLTSDLLEYCNERFEK